MRDNMENKGWRDRQKNSAEQDRVSADREKVSIERDSDVDYLRRKFGVTSTKVMEAVRAVGDDRHAVEEYLRNQIGGYDPKRDVGPRQ